MSSSQPGPADGPAGLWGRLQRTGESSPGALTVIAGSALLWAALSALTLGALIVEGNGSAVIGLLAVAMLCSTLPALFAPQHGRIAAALRVAGLVLALLSLAALATTL